jgi:hypothetical protein
LQCVALLGFALPNDHDVPAEFHKPLSRGSVALSIPLQLRQPIIQSGFRTTGKAAPIMLMPETAVHHHNRFSLRKDQIGNSREITAVQPKP